MSITYTETASAPVEMEAVEASQVSSPNKPNTAVKRSANDQPNAKKQSPNDQSNTKKQKQKKQPKTAESENKERKPAAQTGKKGGKSTAQKPAKQPTTPQLLHDQLSTSLADPSSAPRPGLDPLNIIHRLEHKDEHNRVPLLPSDRNVPSPAMAFTTTSFASKTEIHLTANDLKITQEQKSETKHSFPHLPQNKQSKKGDGITFTLADFSNLFALGSLIERYGRISHMGVLDASYSFFMSKDRQSALYYKVKDGIAVVGGNPLCHQDNYPTILSEFNAFRKKNKLGVTYLGATEQFAQYAKEQKGWVSMRFGSERALNPMKNSVLLEKEGKRIVKQNKQLLDPKRGNLRVGMYVPAQSQDHALEDQLRHVYDTWRNNRNENGQPQAYMTVFDPFALPQLMIYLYTYSASDPASTPNGFAALRRLSNGYHLDPYVQLPEAPRGTSDLLIFSAMALLNRAGVEYMGLGFEPSIEVTEVQGMSKTMTRLTESCYRRAFSRLPISGKKAFHDRWHPDDDLEAGLYIIYPDGTPGLKHSLACLHFANISARRIIREELHDYFSAKNKLKTKPSEDTLDARSENESAVTTKTNNSAKSSLELKMRQQKSTSDLPNEPTSRPPPVPQKKPRAGSDPLRAAVSMDHLPIPAMPTRAPPPPPLPTIVLNSGEIY